MQCYSGYKGEIMISKEEGKELFKEPRKEQFLKITEPALMALKKAVDAEEKAEIAKSLQKKLTEFFTNEQNMQYISCRVFPRLTKEKGIYFDYILHLSINWEARWQNYAIKLKTYQDLNVMLIDTGIFK